MTCRLFTTSRLSIPGSKDGWYNYTNAYDLTAINTIVWNRSKMVCLTKWRGDIGLWDKNSCWRNCYWHMSSDDFGIIFGEKINLLLKFILLYMDWNNVVLASYSFVCVWYLFFLITYLHIYDLLKQHIICFADILYLTADQ